MPLLIDHSKERAEGHDRQGASAVVIDE